MLQMGFVPAAVSAGVAALGFALGKNSSRVVLLLCVVAIAVISLFDHYLISRSRGDAYEALSSYEWLGYISVPLLFAAPGLVGPSLFDRKRIAIVIPVVAIVMLLLGGPYLLYSACILFGACI